MPLNLHCSKKQRAKSNRHVILKVCYKDRAKAQDFAWAKALVSTHQHATAGFPYLCLFYQLIFCPAAWKFSLPTPYLLGGKRRARLHGSCTTGTNHLWSGCDEAPVDRGWEVSLAASPRSSWRRGLPRPTWSPGDARYPVAASTQSLSCLHGNCHRNNYINCDLHCWLFQGQAGSGDLFQTEKVYKPRLAWHYLQARDVGWWAIFFGSSHHTNKLLAQMISDLDQPHTCWCFCSHLYTVGHYKKWVNGPMVI